LNVRMAATARAKSTTCLKIKNEGDQKKRSVALALYPLQNGEIIDPGEIVSPELKKQISPTTLPPPVLDVEK
jgi:hypothetical protein